MQEKETDSFLKRLCVTCCILKSREPFISHAAYTMSFIRVLPEALSIELVSKWFYLVEVRNLDVSLTSIKYRNDFLSILSQSMFNKIELKRETCFEIVNWMKLRKVKLLSLQIINCYPEDDFDDVDQNPQNLLNYSGLDTTRLTSLSLYWVGSYYMNEIGFADLWNSCPNLQDIFVGMSMCFTEVSISLLSALVCDNLRTLRLMSTPDATTLHAIASKFKHLASIVIGDNNRLELDLQTELIGIIVNNFNLETLRLTDSIQFDDEFLIAVTQTCFKLKTFEINCAADCRFSPLIISEMIQKLPFVDVIIIRSHAQEDNNRLDFDFNKTTRKAMFYRGSDELISQILNHIQFSFLCLTIQCLSTTSCHQLAQSIANTCPDLTHLVVHSCDDLLISQFKPIFERCHHLHTLNMTGCNDVLEAEFVTLFSTPNNITNLNIGFGTEALLSAHAFINVLSSNPKLNHVYCNGQLCLEDNRRMIVDYIQSIKETRRIAFCV